VTQDRSIQCPQSQCGGARNSGQRLSSQAWKPTSSAKLLVVTCLANRPPWYALPEKALAGGGYRLLQLCAVGASTFIVAHTTRSMETETKCDQGARACNAMVALKYALRLCLNLWIHASVKSTRFRNRIALPTHRSHDPLYHGAIR
jgi:hypothetical protein